MKANAVTMNILVTGGAGFIGSFLVDALVKKGHDVAVYDSLVGQVHGKNPAVPEYLNKSAKFIRGDVRDREALKRAVEGVDVIFHEASAVGVGQSMYQVEEYVDTNMRGTATLMDVLVNEEHGVKKVLVAASMSSYGEGAYRCPDCGVVHPPLRKAEQLESKDWELRCPACNKTVTPIPTGEEKPLDSNSIYAFSKEVQEKTVLMLAKTYGIPAVSLRYFNVFGPRQSLNNPYTGVVAIFLNRILNGAPPLVFEDGLQTRDFVSVHDVVEANVLAMGKSSANYGAFNVGSGEPTPIKTIAQAIARLKKSDIGPDITLRYRKGDVRHCYADTSKIRRVLGWKPAHSLDSIREVIEWSQTQQVEDNFESAKRELFKFGLVR